MRMNRAHWNIPKIEDHHNNCQSNNKENERFKEVQLHYLGGNVYASTTLNLTDSTSVVPTVMKSHDFNPLLASQSMLWKQSPIHERNGSPPNLRNIPSQAKNKKDDDSMCSFKSPGSSDEDAMVAEETSMMVSKTVSPDYEEGKSNLI